MASGNLVSADFAKNIFLASLPEADQQFLRAQVYLHSFQYQETVYDAGDAIKTAFFPIDCVITELAIMTDGTTVETGLYGREGVVGFTAVLGDSRSSDFKRTLIPGMALATSIDTLRQLFSERGQAYRMLLEYYQTRIKHASRRAVCNARHNSQERLCTWLLMLNDRMESDDIPLTQESVARQLGVRRAGINEMMTALARSGAIGRSRGRIGVLERRVLEEMACACYRGYKTEVDEPMISAGHPSNSQLSPKQINSPLSTNE
jgi:CRP-like cAMP-binding protein